MQRSFTAVRRLIAVSAVALAPVLAAGCADCATVATCTQTVPACPAPAVAYVVNENVPVCDDSVAFDGSVIQSGHLVYDGAKVNRALAGMPPHAGYAAAVYTTAPQAATAVAAKPEPKKAALKEAVRVDNVKPAKPAKAKKKDRGESARVAGSEMPVVVAKPAPAPAKPAPAPIKPEAPRVVVLPPVVTAPYIVGDGPDKATIPGDAPVVHLPVPNVGEAYVDPTEAARVAAPSAARVLGPSSMGISDAEIDHYSKSESFGVPPEPAPVPE